MRDKGNRIEVVYHFEGGQIAGDQLQDKLRRSAYDAIAGIDITRITAQAHSVAKSQNFRIDMQGIFSTGNKYFYNLQLQINKPRKSGQSTTYATVLVPQAELGSPYINTRRLRHAFIRSLLQREIIRIVTRPITTPDQDMGGEDERLEKYFGEDEQIEENMNEGLRVG